MRIFSRILLLILLVNVTSLVVPATHAYSTQPAGKGNIVSERVLHLVGFGDSLMAGYGLAASEAFPAVLERELRAKGYAVRVSNAGVSGDTTAGGLARIGWTLSDSPDLLILELGANDALRGLSPVQAKANLADILEQCQQAGVLVLLAGMLAPGNMDIAYRRAFDSMYAELAAEYDVPLYPFFLEGVAMKVQLNLDDGMHPNARGVEVIVRNMLPYVERAISALPK